MSLTSECELARRAKTGDQAAYAEIIRLHQQAVYNVAYRMLGNSEDAEDAAQDAFIRAHQFFDRYDAKRPLAPWLKRITVNVCLNRINATKPTVSLDDGMPAPKDPQPSPEGQALSRQREERIRTEIRRLPGNYRAVIEMRHFQDLSYDEIARALKRPLNTVKSDLFRARKLLAVGLKDLEQET